MNLGESYNTGQPTAQKMIRQIQFLVLEDQPLQTP